MKQENRITAVYTRVSTDHQDVSIELQEKKCLGLCDLHDFQNVEVFKDFGHSGKSFKRPELQRLLAMMSAGKVGNVVIFRLDRLSRSVADLSSFIEKVKTKNIALHSYSEAVDTSSSSGVLFLNILGSMAQFERESIAARIRDALAHKKASGKKYCRVAPYGKKYVGRDLVDNPDEIGLIKRIASMKATMTFKAISAKLNLDKVPTRSGQPWTMWAVTNVFYNHRKGVYG